MVWRTALLGGLATFVGATALDALLDGTAFWTALAALGLLVGLTLRWVLPRQEPRRGQHGRA